jgi:hypothetical protein
MSMSACSTVRKNGLGDSGVATTLTGGNSVASRHTYSLRRNTRWPSLPVAAVPLASRIVASAQYLGSARIRFIHVTWLRSLVTR